MMKSNLSIFSPAKSFKDFSSLITNILTPLETPPGYKFVKETFKKIFQKMKPVAGDLSLINSKRYSQNFFKINFDIKTVAMGKFSGLR